LWYILLYRTRRAFEVAVLREEKFVCADIGTNHNKQWIIILHDDFTVETMWTRIGDSLSSKRFPFPNDQFGAEKFMDSKIRDKTRTGRKSGTYVPARVLAGTVAAKTVQNNNLSEIAKRQIQTNSPETVKLVDILIKENVHNITSATTLKYNSTTGLFSTPMGIVTSDAIVDARELLNDIGVFVQGADYDDPRFREVTNRYLNIIPTIIERRNPTVESIFPSLEAVKKQNDILDSLEGALQVALAKPDEDGEPEPEQRLFECKLYLEQDGRVFDRINAFYKAGIKGMHSTSGFRVITVYQVEITPMKVAFDGVKDKVGNVMELWHGTKTGNLLSILKNGFIIPKSGGSIQVTGRMYGDGIYFSDSSTKSLNYSYGYWGGTRSNHCFMFMCDVAMGKTYNPSGGWGSRYPASGYDSTFAKGTGSYGGGGVINNEMIVYKTDQLSPKYLVECQG
jgi:poly [ADP-ribose] polymerase